MRILAILLISATTCWASQDEPTKDELRVTVQHIVAIAKQQQIDLTASQKALTDAKTVEIPKLKSQIDAQATKLASAQVSLAKAHAACWRNLIMGLIAGAVLAFVGPKLLPLLTAI